MKQMFSGQKRGTFNNQKGTVGLGSEVGTVPPKEGHLRGFTL